MKGKKKREKEKKKKPWVERNVRDDEIQSQTGKKKCEKNIFRKRELMVKWRNENWGKIEKGFEKGEILRYLQCFDSVFNKVTLFVFLFKFFSLVWLLKN